MKELNGHTSCRATAGQVKNLLFKEYVDESAGLSRVTKLQVSLT